MKGALIGAGYFAQFHAEAWQRLQRTTAVEIIAVVDPAPGKASGFAKSFHIPRAYDSPDQMLVAEHPDFVDIITRPESHLALTTLAAHHGAHVICQNRWLQLSPNAKPCAKPARKPTSASLSTKTGAGNHGIVKSNA